MIAIKQGVNKNMRLNKGILTEISRQINSKSFHKTELYKLLRDELSNIGNWRAKQRGNPRAGYQAMQRSVN